MTLRIFLTAGLAACLLLPVSAQAASCGKASWYALTSRTASGEMMDASKLTAAHRTLPLGTWVQVTNQTNGRSITVRINDRGPFTHNRILDLSKAAAHQLAFVSKGIAKVCLTTTWTVPLPPPRPAAAAWASRSAFLVSRDAFVENHQPIAD